MYNKVKWIWFLSLIVVYSNFLWCEMTKCLKDEIKWNELCMHCDIVLNDYWPSDNTSEETSSTFGWELTANNWKCE